MKSIVILNSIEPLNFRASRSTSNSETLDYIPGTSILGGFAAAHIKVQDDKDEFADFFLTDKVRFGNLYPANFGTESAKNPLEDVDKLPVKPLPATARSCKRFSGFLFNADADKEDRESHGVTDHLVIWGLFALSEQKRGELLNQNRNCTYQLEDGLCNESLDRFSGFYRHGENKNELAKAKLKKRMLTRTGISRETGTVHKAILYNREAINEGQKFWGEFQFENDELFEGFKEFAEKVSCQKLLRLGNNRTRGMGLLKVDKTAEREDDSYYECFKERVSSFDKKFREKAEGQVELPHKFYFPITLQSDMIVRDHFLRYRTRLDGDYLRDAYNLGNSDLIYHSAGIRRVIGWNALWGLPEDYKQAMSMGSVFLFGYNGTVDDNFLEKLFEIESKGIGIHRSEGFGEVTIADRFHWEVDGYGNEDN